MKLLDPSEQRRADKRETSIRHFAGLLLLAVAVVAGYLLINSSYFVVSSIIVEGNHFVPEEEVLRLAGFSDQPLNIFRFKPAEIERRLKRDLRIASVNIERRLPATVIISIKERQPLAYVASGYGFVQIDRDCLVIGAFKNFKKIEVPLITGVRLGNVFVGDRIDAPQVVNVVSYLANLDPKALAMLSEVNARPDGFTAYTLNSVEIRLGNGEQMPEKAQWTNTIMAEIAEKQPAIEFVDLTSSPPFIKLRSNK